MSECRICKASKNASISFFTSLNELCKNWSMLGSMFEHYILDMRGHWWHEQTSDVSMCIIPKCVHVHVCAHTHTKHTLMKATKDMKEVSRTGKATRESIGSKYDHNTPYMWMKLSTVWVEKKEESCCVNVICVLLKLVLHCCINKMDILLDMMI